MKTIGIIGAMEEEVSALKAKMDVVAAKKVVGVDFFIGKMHSKSVILVRSGIGKVNAAICTQVLIDMYGVDYIINTGVAGAISSDLDVCDVVISDDCVQHDFDCSSYNNFPRGAIPGIVDSFFKSDEELVRLAHEAGVSVLGNDRIHVGRVASGDQFIASGESKRFIGDTFQALCTEMEGAAIAHTCYLNKIPFVVIRAISDKADESANITFEEIFRVAAKNSSDITELIIKNI